MKSNKELAVELAAAVVIANPRVNLKGPGGVDMGVPALTTGQVEELVNHFYGYLEKLDNSTGNK